MATQSRTFVIVGGGLAAAEAAKTLRDEGYEDRLVVVAGERRLPYERPPLSKEYLRGQTRPAKLLVQAAEFYDERSIELLGRQAVELDAAARRLTLDDGRVLGFDRLLLATGASARALPGTSAPPPWVHTLRTIDDADRLRGAACVSESVVVAGGGWIAAEAAASLRQLGLAVTLVVPGDEVLEARLGPSVGRRFGDLHRRNGVSVITRTRVAGLADGPRERGIRTDDGRVVSGDLVVLGLGARPNVDLARDAGLPVDDGVAVDERLVTPAEAVLAAGDVASAINARYGRRMRSEHWDNARRQGRAAARTMLGSGDAYDRVPFFYSDQFDLGMELLGDPSAGDEVVVRELDDAWVALWLEDGRVVAGMHANAWDAKRPIDRLVSAGAVVDPAAVRDPSVPLDELDALAAA